MRGGPRAVNRRRQQFDNPLRLHEGLRELGHRAHDLDYRGLLEPDLPYSGVSYLPEARNLPGNVENGDVNPFRGFLHQFDKILV